MNDTNVLIKTGNTEILTSHLSSLTNVTVLLQADFNTIDLDNFNALSSGLKTYVNTTSFRLDNANGWENRRSLITVLIFVFYLLVIAFVFVGFFKRWSNFLLGMSILLLFSLPVILLFEGVITTYYFIYSDVCQEVHDAIYENKFPISDKGLGFFVSCFNSKTKSALYSYAYQLDQVDNEIKIRLNSNTTNSEDFETYVKFQKEIKTAKEDHLSKLIECSHVYNSVTFYEDRFCVNGMAWARFLLSSYTWLFLIIFLTAYAVNRMKPVVEKKKSEIESMLQNEDLIENSG